MSFYAKWEIELDFDYVEFMISTDNGGSWSPLCGKFTNEGNSDQDLGNQLYDGIQTYWVFEEVDLTDYLGSTNIRFKFRLVTDNFTTEGGFSFDDFKVFTDGYSDASLGNYSNSDFIIYPNPANSQITVYAAGENDINSISIYSNLGQLLVTDVNPSSKTTLNTSDYDNGVYFVKITTHSNQIIIKKISLVK